MDPFNESIIIAERDAKAEYNRLLSTDLDMVTQRAKAIWVKQVDSNSAYFHTLVKERQNRSFISCITDSSGQIITDPSLIEKEFVSYYIDLFGTDKEVQPFNSSVIEEGKVLTNEESARISRPFEKADVKKALFSIPSKKAPGPDGFSSGFYKQTWDYIGDEISAAVLEFFESGKILQQINATNVTLVPKVRCPKEVADFRPISCCNIIYKLISKLLADRLTEFLPELIDNTQSAFVKGRSITTNILLCQDIVRSYNRKSKKNCCLIKLDLKKAYDSLNWSFLLNILRAMNFPEKIFKWIELCLSTAKFSIVINGRPCGYFPAKRGLRQGDPISPYLFVIAMEFLSRKMKSLDTNPLFKFHYKCKEMKIKHLEFADDLMFVCRADRNSPLQMMAVFEEFSALSGLQVDQMKSSIFFGGVKEDDRLFLLDALGFKEGHLPIRYLGLPLISSILSTNDCAHVIEKIFSRIASWAARKLSYSGCLQLIKSVLSHIESYWCGVFLMPKGVQEKIDSICGRFLWSGSVEKDAMTLVSWKEVCSERKEGGLGIRQIRCWNKATLAKQIWSICTGHSYLWTSWMQKILLHGKNIWSAEIPIDCSFSWRKILQLRPHIEEFIKIKIGDDRQTSLFYDDWLQGGKTIHKLASPEETSVWGHDIRVADWWHNGSWNIPDSFKRRHREIADQIQQVQLTADRDETVWSLTSSCQLTTSSCYKQMKEDFPNVIWNNLVWDKQIFPRHGFILWLTVLGRLKLNPG